MLEQISSVFFEEANELLDNLEEQLLALEEDPKNSEVISAVFRAMHTIKGSSGMFGFNAVSSFTHEVESALDLVRNGTIPVTKELIDLMLKTRDHIRTMLAAGTNVSAEIQSNSDTLIAAFKSYVEKNGGPSASAAGSTTNSGANGSAATAGSSGTTANSAGGQTNASNQNNSTSEQTAQNNSGSSVQNGTSPVPDIPPETATWRIKFRPSATIMQNGTRPELLVKELTELGTATVVAFSQDVPPLSKISSERCYYSWDVILTTSKTENDIRDVFIFLDNDSTFTVEKISLGPEMQHRIGEILIDRGEVTQQDLDDLVQHQKKIGQLLVENKVVSQQQVQSALAEQQHLKMLNPDGTVSQSSTAATPNAAPQTGTAAAVAAAQQSIRVNSEKLDTLVDLVGELVTFNARLSQLALDQNLPAFTNLSEQCERLVVSLRDNAMEMRMLPIGSIFSRFRRLVRDLSEQLGKNVEMYTEGAETEIDKTVIEKLNDPLIHLIRNSVDHGIELPADRIKAGKDPQGKVTLSARHAGSFVLITISDDGAGLDRAAIRAKGIEKGLIKETDKLTDEEIDNLIFLPGFSTSKVVTAVSGRGVGMDVVRRDIGSLGGTVGIESTTGKGSSFILKIPLTLAIIDGMLVSLGKIKYIIPLASISECLSYEENKKTELFPKIINRGKELACIDLRVFFHVNDECTDDRQIVVINDQDSKIGIIVDRILGEHQTVIKPLGTLYKNCTGLSGATILGDGSVALIIDVFKLSEIIRKADKKKK